jgi:glycogen(starch) synthase
VASWWQAVKREPLPSTWNRYRREVTRAIQAVDVLTAPSQAMLQAVEVHYGPDLPETRVVPNGRKAERFRAASKEPFVLTAGRLWDHGKNAAAVAQVAPGLEWPVYLAGDDRGPDGASPRFEGCWMLGRLPSDELAECYSRASIYALPARYEPFGLSALEAALSGCALVLGDIASLREIWQDAAVYVSPDDPDELLAVMRELIGDRPRRESLAHRAEARARVFTPERMARGYVQAYRAAAELRRTACVS